MISMRLSKVRGCFYMRQDITRCAFLILTSDIFDISKRMRQEFVESHFHFAERRFYKFP